MNGFHMARLIVQQEGVRGLYRGFWPSLATFVPNSALWWGAYGFWQRLLWEQLPAGVAQQSSSSGGSSSIGHSTGTVVAVQTTASVLSGCTTSVLTNPLDLVKTRLQVS
jgi:solute carrier family 25 protein 44